VSSIFVVASFFALRSRGSATRVALAGLLLALAACLRFSELVFFIPAGVQLIVERRVRDGVLLAGVGTVAAVTIQAIADAAYWGTPFSSAREVLKFTLVDRLSSRGYEPAWYYLAELTSWTDVLTVGLAVVGWRVADWRLNVWLWLPIVLLSALPHKEPRYLIPSLPFLSLVAAAGLAWLIHRLTHLHSGVGDERQSVMRWWKPAIAVALVCGLGLRTVFVVSGYHVRRTDAEVALAREVDLDTNVKSAAFEAAWRFGWHLYLVRLSRVDDLTPQDVASPEELRVAIGRHPVELVALSGGACKRLACADILLESGFRELTYPSGPAAGYRTFRKAR
jgi:hypothetical protein